MVGEFTVYPRDERTQVNAITMEERMKKEKKRKMQMERSEEVRRGEKVRRGGGGKEESGR